MALNTFKCSYLIPLNFKGLTIISLHAATYTHHEYSWYRNGGAENAGHEIAAHYNALIHTTQKVCLLYTVGHKNARSLITSYY